MTAPGTTPRPACRPALLLAGRRWLGLMWLAAAALQLAGCAAVGQLPQLEEGYYQVVNTNDDSLARAMAPTPRRRFYVEQAHDTLLLLPPAPAAGPLRYPLRAGRHVVLLRRTFDFDIFTLPFKIRPPRENLPIQLNTTFNAALYFGRRLDFYHLNRHRLPAGRTVPLNRTTGLGYGLFTGLGSSLITADNTHQRAATDYEGLVIHSGGALIYDARVFNVGVAVGTDKLLGPDGPSWVYNFSPWLGFLFGLNLN